MYYTKCQHNIKKHNQHKTWQKYSVKNISSDNDKVYFGQVRFLRT